MSCGVEGLAAGGRAAVIGKVEAHAHLATPIAHRRTVARTGAR
jgi:hypothetical protein